MIHFDELGRGLGDDHVVVKIARDVRFMDEIVEKAGEMDDFKIIAWGNAINLAVRLAMDATRGTVQGFSVAGVQIGTQEEVQMRNEKVRPLSWMEITIKRGVTT